MIKNDFKINMLFLFIAIFVASCAVNNRSSQAVKSAGAKNSNQLRGNIGDFAKKHKGIKYKYAGTTTKGFDCSGFTKFVFDEFNIQLSRSSNLQSKQGKRVNLKWVEEGDLLFFGSGGKITHVALVVENKKDGISVIHSTTSRGVVVDNVSNSRYWQKRIMFARNVIDD